MPENKKVNITFRTTEQIKKSIEENAAQDDIRKSEYLRRLVQEDTKRRKKIK